MFCKYCGKEINDNVKFCPACGMAQGSAAAPVYGSPIYTEIPSLPMKWFKFLIYFSLFAGCLLYLVSGVLMVTGEIYNLYGVAAADALYDAYPEVQYLDIALGCGMFVCSFLALMTRFRLAGYYKNGPTLLNSLYLLIAILNIGQVIAMYFIFPEEVFNAMDVSSAFTSFALSMAMVSANATYFKKRAAIFSR